MSANPAIPARLESHRLPIATPPPTTTLPHQDVTGLAIKPLTKSMLFRCFHLGSDETLECCCCSRHLWEVGTHLRNVLVRQKAQTVNLKGCAAEQWLIPDKCEPSGPSSAPSFTDMVLITVVQNGQKLEPACSTNHLLKANFYHLLFVPSDSPLCVCACACVCVCVHAHLERCCSNQA